MNGTWFKIALFLGGLLAGALGGGGVSAVQMGDLRERVARIETDVTWIKSHLEGLQLADGRGMIDISSGEPQPNH